jgi:AbrB family looped-hinge helix DNA binding protein
MRINSKGQVTIPAPLREKYDLHEGDEVDVGEVGDSLQIVRRGGAESRGKRLRTSFPTIELVCPN